MAEVDELLVRALAERDGLRRRRLLALMAAAPSPRAQTLVAVVDVLRTSDDLSARTAAMEVMAALGEVGYPALGGLLVHDAVSVRRLAVDVLSMNPSPAALPLLERATGDVSTTIRAAALDGVARIAGSAAERLLLRQLDADVPAPVALAALLGLEQRGARVPPATARRWLDDALTAASALRALGRAGDVVGVLPAVTSLSRLRARAAIVGLADGLERGAALEPQLLTAPMRMQLVDVAMAGDFTAGAAAVVALAHVGDLGGVIAALRRDDASALLPALHRAVELAGLKGVDVTGALRDLASGSERGAFVARELEEAFARRSQIPAPAPRALARPPSLSEATFELVAGWFARVAGLALGGDARARVEARLAPRLEARGIASFDGYLSLLDADAAEAAAAIDAVTVHETYFFREPVSLDGLRVDAVPALWPRHAPSAAQSEPPIVQVWSAGCSSGEEAFTIAGILWEQRRLGALPCDFAVVGTDVSPASIEQARRALYGQRSFRRPLTTEEASLFETPSTSGVRRPRAELRERVTFHVMNLCDDTSVRALPIFDVVFCRNVLIYLTTEARRRVLQSFFDHLRPGGVLFLGHSESLLHVESPFELWPLRRGLAYRRPAT